MRLREPVIPDWLSFTIAVPIVVAVLPAVALGFAVAALIWAKRQAMGPQEEWSRWFAWYPVRVERLELRWMEMVERRSFGIMSNTQFRAVKHITA